MTSQVWMPGAAGPHEELVRNVLRRVAAMGEEASVSVELADGSLFDLISISPEPGFGFVTLEPHPEGEHPVEVVVPVASIAQIRIGRAEPHVRPGFSVPAAKR